MFEIGDAVVHPVHGAGVVTDIEKLQRRRGSKEYYIIKNGAFWPGFPHQLVASDLFSVESYYRIELLGQERTSLMIPAKAAKARGLRYAIRQSRLNRVWRVLRAAPEKLPAYYKERYELVKSKLRTGDLLQVAGVVRDMAWRRKREGSLNTRGKRMYKEGIRLLAGEIAAAQGMNLTDGEAQVRARLWESLHPRTAV